MRRTILLLLGAAILVALVYYTDLQLAPTQQAAVMAAPGEVPPQAVFKDLSGKPVKISDLRGKVVFVDFWATWCDACMVEIPWLIELQKKYGSDKFTIVGVAMDETGASVVDPFLATQRFKVNGEDLPINYPVLIGNDQGAQSLVPNLEGFPTSVLISRDNKIIKTTVGLVSYDEMEKDIRSQLGPEHAEAARPPGSNP